MAKGSYEPSLARLLAHEGGYTNHPSDPGGPTNFGITIFDYRKYCKPGATASDVKAMTLAEAKSIYRAKYWDAQRCDDLPAGVDYAVFDYGVNSGIGRSGKVLRRCLHIGDDSSVVNDAVIAAANAAPAVGLIVAICDERLRFLKSLKTWDVFGKGWGRRVAEVKAYSLALSNGPADRIGLGPEDRPQRDGGVPISPPPAAPKTTMPVREGGAAAAATTTAVAAHQAGFSLWQVVIIAVAAGVIVFAAIHLLKKKG